MKKNGFTLIELLAVIVILAIIALIATPIILGIINDARSKANERSAELYLNAVDLAVARKNLTSTFMPNKCFVNEKGNLECDNLNDELVIDVEGLKPTEGLIAFENGNVINYRNLKFGDNYAKIGKEGVVFTNKYETVCKSVEKPLFGTVYDGVTYSPGNEVICEVGPEEYYNFIVVSTEDNNITLIALENIGVSPWITKEDFLEAGGTLTDWNATTSDYPTSKGKYTMGPITAIKYLNEKTQNWVNVENLNETYTDSYGHYKMHLTGKARLLSASSVNIYDVADILSESGTTGTTVGGDFYLMDSAPNEYWDGSWGYSEESYFGYVSSFEETIIIGGSYMEISNYGIRPVITMKKEDFEVMYNFGEYTCLPVSGNDLEFTYTTKEGKKIEKYSTGSKNIGDAYKCKVNDYESYIFNVIGKNGDNVDLMINYNMIQAAWNDERDWGGTPNPPYDNAKPITALSSLKTITDTWTNISPRTDSITKNSKIVYYTDEDASDISEVESQYTVNYTGYRARIATDYEIHNAINPKTNNWYLANLEHAEHANIGNSYWVIADTESLIDDSKGWYVTIATSLWPEGYYEGLTSYIDESTDELKWEKGVRPVITVPASKIK